MSYVSNKIQHSKISHHSHWWPTSTWTTPVTICRQTLRYLKIIIPVVIILFNYIFRSTSLYYSRPYFHCLCHPVQNNSGWVVHRFGVSASFEMTKIWLRFLHQHRPPRELKVYSACIFFSLWSPLHFPMSSTIIDIHIGGDFEWANMIFIVRSQAKPFMWGTPTRPTGCFWVLLGRCHTAFTMYDRRLYASDCCIGLRYRHSGGVVISAVKCYIEVGL